MVTRCLFSGFRIAYWKRHFSRSSAKSSIPLFPFSLPLLLLWKEDMNTGIRSTGMWECRFFMGNWIKQNLSISTLENPSFPNSFMLRNTRFKFVPLGTQLVSYHEFSCFLWLIFSEFDNRNIVLANVNGTRCRRFAIAFLKNMYKVWVSSFLSFLQLMKTWNYHWYLKRGQIQEEVKDPRAQLRILRRWL